MNTAVAMSRVQDSSVLLSDFDLNSGMVRFMLKLDSAYCVTDAAEHALEMDESLWPTMVTSHGQAGRAARWQTESGLPHRADPDPPSDGVHAAQLHSLCFDMSGNLERYSLEIMHESKRIFLVCTPEIPSLHLAREKYLYLNSWIWATASRYC